MDIRYMGLLPDTQNWGLRVRRECRERLPRYRFQRKPLVNDPGMHHGTSSARHVEIANPRWRGKRSRHSRRMRNPQFYVSVKRPIARKVGSWTSTSSLRHFKRILNGCLTGPGTILKWVKWSWRMWANWPSFNHNKTQWTFLGKHCMCCRDRLSRQKVVFFCCVILNNSGNSRKCCNPSGFNNKEMAFMGFYYHC